MSNIIPPKLDDDQYSLIKVDVNTGIILQTNGEFYLGIGEIFIIFNNLNETLDYIDNELFKNIDLEFLIFDFKGIEFMMINRNGKTEIKKQ